MIAAGNDGRGANGDNPDTFASIPAFDNPGMVIIAGAVGVGGNVVAGRLADRVVRKTVVRPSQDLTSLAWRGLGHEV